MRYIAAVDQSTQGTKVLLLDENCSVCAGCCLNHRQIVSEKGWVSHNPEEIYANVVRAVKQAVEAAGALPSDVAAISVSNQRETTVCFEKRTGRSLADAIVWQCSRAKDISDSILSEGFGDYVKNTSGIPVSPYFPASKIAWFLQNCPEIAEKAVRGEALFGTVDTYLVYRLTGRYLTDFSNASRTGLLSLKNLNWDEELLKIFGIPRNSLPEIVDSDSCFGYTTLDGYFEKPVPVSAVLGDSHASLFGHGCLTAGTAKATYGTGSSVMMNIGQEPKISPSLVTSLAWSISGKPMYVIEGNINYTGAVITWLEKDLGLLSGASECEKAALSANKNDETFLVPAFSGLGAPYWRDDAKAVICGMSRTTGRNEIIRAGVESIAFQVTDIVKMLERETGIKIRQLHADGAPTRNAYLMQFQADLADCTINIPACDEVSALGAGLLAGKSIGLFPQSLEPEIRKTVYPSSDRKSAGEKYKGWLKAVELTVPR